MNKDDIQSAINEIRSLREFDERNREINMKVEKLKKLHELALQDPVVRNFMIQKEIGEINFEEALINMVLMLADEKEHYKNETIKYAQNYGTL